MSSELTEREKRMLEILKCLARALPRNKSACRTCYAINNNHRDMIHSMIDQIKKEASENEQD